MSARPQELLLAYYGDDFTGSTDALEFLSRAGIRTVLFMQPPGHAQLERYPGLQAAGVAGMSRSMSPDQMEKELRPAFNALNALGAAHIHYKVCSTFDSSPAIGSIGRAIDIGRIVFAHNGFVPVLGGTPALGRYCAFGNLFARMGIGSNGPIHRLDRHPSMSTHPITPADEADLRLHLSRQTKKRIGLLDILQIKKPLPELRKSLQSILDDGAELVLLDALYEDQMAAIGALLDSYAIPGRSLFSVGSSGIEMALGAWWLQEGRLPPPGSWPAPGKAAPLLVVSGSRSPVTASQIAWAVSQGFREISLDATAMMTPASMSASKFPATSASMSAAASASMSPVLQKDIDHAISLLRQGYSVIVHTGGPLATAMPPALMTAALGGALGRIVREAVMAIPLQRVVIAGGDTSSFAARALDLEAVEMIAPLSPGAPLCRTYAPGSPIDGLEINLKGGQVGSEDYFGKALEGK